MENWKFKYTLRLFANKKQLDCEKKIIGEVGEVEEGYLQHFRKETRQERGWRMD
jgi:hypothetical protein